MTIREALQLEKMLYHIETYVKTGDRLPLTIEFQPASTSPFRIFNQQTEGSGDSVMEALHRFIGNVREGIPF